MRPASRRAVVGAALLTVLSLAAPSLGRRDCHVICTKVRHALNPLKPCKASRRASRDLGAACKAGFDQGFQHVCTPLCEHGDVGRMGREASAVCGLEEGDQAQGHHTTLACEAGYVGVLNQAFQEMRNLIAGPDPRSLDELIGAHHPHVVEVLSVEAQREDEPVPVPMPTPEPTPEPTPAPTLDADTEAQVQAGDVFSDDDGRRWGEDEDEPVETVDSVFGRPLHVVRMRVTVPTLGFNASADADPSRPRTKDVYVDLVANGTWPTLQDAVHVYCRDAELGPACARIALLTTHQQLFQQPAAADVPVSVSTFGGPSARFGDFDMYG